MSDQDLFGAPVSYQPPPVAPVQLYERTQIDRIVELDKPRCAHCIMNRGAWLQLRRQDRPSERPPILPAHYRHTGRDGSFLQLCEMHSAQQASRQERAVVDAEEADHYRTLRDMIISLMTDPDHWLGPLADYRTEHENLVHYVQQLHRAWQERGVDEHGR